MTTARISFCRHKGPRQTLEDAGQVLVLRIGGDRDLELVILIVCDGVGGSVHGEVASALATAHVIAFLLRAIVAAQADGDQNLFSSDGLRHLLVDASESANQVVLDAAAAEPRLEGMATTLVCGLIYDGMLHVAWAGDSRAYVFQKDRLQQVTHDHREVQPLIDAGELTPEEAEAHPLGHVINRCLGMPEDFSISTRTVPLEGDALVLLCTDGLSGALPAEQICAAMLQEPAVEGLSARLVQAALDAGTTDNVTAAICACRSPNAMNGHQTPVGAYARALAQRLYR